MIQFIDSSYDGNDMLKVLAICKKRSNDCLSKLLEFLHNLDRREDALYVLHANIRDGDFGFNAYTPWHEGSKGDPYSYAGRKWAQWIVGGVNWSESMGQWSGNS